MKIGMLVNNLTISGGYQKLVINLSKELTQFGHQITIYTLAVDKRKCYPEEIKDVNIFTLSESEIMPKYNVTNIFGRIFNALSEKQFFFNKYAKLGKQIDKDTEVLILHDSYMIHCLNHIHLRRDPKTIWMLNNQLDSFSNLKVLISSLFTQYPINSLNIKLSIFNFFIRIPLILTVIRDYFSYRIGIPKISVFAVYDKYNQFLVKEFLNKHATVVSAGADITTFKSLFHERNYNEGMQIKLLSVGVMFRHRRYEDIIYATKILIDKGFHPITNIVGSHQYCEDYFEELTQLIKSNNLENYVIFHESIPSTELQEMYNGADIFIFVNNGFTWGISVFEAIAAGLPVIISDNIGAVDLIKNRNLGWIVHPCSPEEISNSVIEIISNSQKTKEIINKAFLESNEFVSWKAYANRMNQLIKS